MGLFTKEKKLKVIPRTEESKAGGRYLMDILKEPPPEIPVREVADLTPIQRLILDRLPSILQGTEETSALATGELTKQIKGEYDPRTSPYYKGIREEADILTREGMTSIAQEAEKGGMYKSTPRLGAQGDFLTKMKSNILQQLGLLYESERGRTTQAARDIGQVEGQNIANIAAVGGVAETERAVQEAKNEALYMAALQQVMFPYTTMSQIANVLTQVQNQGVVTGGGLTDLGFGLATLAGFGGSYYGAKAGAA